MPDDRSLPGPADPLPSASSALPRRDFLLQAGQLGGVVLVASPVLQRALRSMPLAPGSVTSAGAAAA